MQEQNEKLENLNISLCTNKDNNSAQSSTEQFFNNCYLSVQTQSNGPNSNEVIKYFKVAIKDCMWNKQSSVMCMVSFSILNTDDKTKHGGLRFNLTLTLSLQHGPRKNFMRTNYFFIIPAVSLLISLTQYNGTIRM